MQKSGELAIPGDRWVNISSTVGSTMQQTPSILIVSLWI